MARKTFGYLSMALIITGVLSTYGNRMSETKQQGRGSGRGGGGRGGSGGRGGRGGRGGGKKESILELAKVSK